MSFTGGAFLESGVPPQAAEVLAGRALPNLETLPFPDPDHFIAGGVSRAIKEWESFLDPVSQASSTVLGWLQQGVVVDDFLRPWEGEYQGRAHSGSKPPHTIFPNASICQKFQDVIEVSILEDLASGAITLLGKVGEVDPPHLVSPLTVEPTKPRVCLDLRFLNCWIKDSPFTLDTLKDIPRSLRPGAYMAKLDDKCGYKNMWVHPSSRSLFGFEWCGYYFWMNTLPFGWKSSAYVYHTTNCQIADFLRRHQVPVLTFIDDRWLSEIMSTDSPADGFTRAQIAIYAACQIVLRLGFFINLEKSVLVPQRVILFLGLHIHSIDRAFSVPSNKKKQFQELREYILGREKVRRHTLQRFAGKCISFLLAVPAAKLYTAEVNLAISRSFHTVGRVPVSPALRQEILYWRFLDHCRELFPWREETHVSVTLASDASGFKWGASIHTKGDTLNFGDYFTVEDCAHTILVKEALALENALRAISMHIRNKRVTVQVDNMALLGAWQRQGSRSTPLNNVLKDIFHLLVQCNVHLTLEYVSSQENPADAPSRLLTKADAKLTPTSWLYVNQAFGGADGHSLDLMALDSNSMTAADGTPLRHFTPWPSPGSAGVNMFSQRVSPVENCYVFPPISLIASVLAFVREQGLTCSVVVPFLQPLPPWFPMLQASAVSFLLLGEKGEKDVLLFPSRSGYRRDQKGLPWALLVARVVPRQSPGPYPDLDTPALVPPLLSSGRIWVLVLADSMLRFLKGAAFRLSEKCRVVSIGGCTLHRMRQVLPGEMLCYKPRCLLLHVGTNNVNRLDVSECFQLQSAFYELEKLCQLIKQLQSHCHFAVIISLATATQSDGVNARLRLLNNQWKVFCQNFGWAYTSHQGVSSPDLVDFVHLNGSGRFKVFHAIRQWFQ